MPAAYDLAKLMKEENLSVDLIKKLRDINVAVPVIEKIQRNLNEYSSFLKFNFWVFDYCD
jgi:hypothetical protein